MLALTDSYFDGGLDEDSEDEDVGYDGSLRCKGICASGLRCKVLETSPYPTARTIAATGYCTHHVSQRTWPEPTQDVDAPRLPRGDTPLTSAAREAQADVVLELLSAGRNPRERNQRWQTPLEAAEEGFQSLAHRPSLQKPEKAREMLQRRARLNSIKAMLAVALESGPMPERPPIPAEPKEDDPASMTMEQLKALLRKHKGKLSGKKADLVERVRQGGFLAMALSEKMQEHRQALERVAKEWMEAQFKVNARAEQLRLAAVPEPVTDEQVEEVVAVARAKEEAVREAAAKAKAEAQARAEAKARALKARVRAAEEAATAALKRRRVEAAAAAALLPRPHLGSRWQSTAAEDDEEERAAAAERTHRHVAAEVEHAANARSKTAQEKAEEERAAAAERTYRHVAAEIERAAKARAAAAQEKADEAKAMAAAAEAKAKEEQKVRKLVADELARAAKARAAAETEVAVGRAGKRRRRLEADLALRQGPSGYGSRASKNPWEHWKSARYQKSCRCGKIFGDGAALRSHLKDSSKCPFSAKNSR